MNIMTCHADQARSKCGDEQFTIITAETKICRNKANMWSLQTQYKGPHQAHCIQACNTSPLRETNFILKIGLNKKYEHEDRRHREV
jgi:hypothetical protein